VAQPLKINPLTNTNARRIQRNLFTAITSYQRIYSVLETL
jgi:hypothetical protein